MLKFFTSIGCVLLSGVVAILAYYLLGWAIPTLLSLHWILLLLIYPIVGMFILEIPNLMKIGVKMVSDRYSYKAFTAISSLIFTASFSLVLWDIFHIDKAEFGFVKWVFFILAIVYMIFVIAGTILTFLQVVFDKIE